MASRLHSLWILSYPSFTHISEHLEHLNALKEVLLRVVDSDQR